MNAHKNARLTPRGRERIVEPNARGRTPDAVGVCPRTASNSIARHRSGSTGSQLAALRQRPEASSSRLDGFAASAGRASRLPRKPASHRPLSAEFYVVLACTG